MPNTQADNRNWKPLMDRIKRDPTVVSINDRTHRCYEEVLYLSSFPDKLFEFSETQNAYIGFLSDLQRYEPNHGFARFQDDSILFSIIQNPTHIVLVFEALPEDYHRIDAHTRAITAHCSNKGFEHIRAIIFIDQSRSAKTL